MVEEVRVVRLAFPVGLLRKIDELVQHGAGGYETRTEFVIDSVRQNIEVMQAEDRGGDPHAMTVVPTAPVLRVQPRTPPVMNLQGLDIGSEESFRGTAIRAVGETDLVTDVKRISRVEPRVLFGMHNRDYPSLWAASQLARATREHLVSYEEFQQSVADKAWKQGRALEDLEKRTGRKTTALFPTNPGKRKSAEMAFRQYAVGRVMGDPTDPGRLLADGPLFQWHVAALAGTPEDPFLGLTPQGHRLLVELDGLSVEEPHPRAASRAFLDYLAGEAPLDFCVLLQVVAVVGPEGASRREVLDDIGERWPGWTANERSTNTAGYIARAREWGLLRPKQTAGKYQLSELGLQYLESNNTHNEGEQR